MEDEKERFLLIVWFLKKMVDDECGLGLICVR